MRTAAAPAPHPRRRPGRPLADRLLAAFTADQWRRGLAVHALVWGAGYLLGPDSWASSSSFDVILRAGIPLRAYGGAAVLAGLVLLLAPRWARTAHGIAAVLWFIWAAGLFLAIPTGSAMAWGGWLHVLVVSAIHRHLSGVGRGGK